MKSNGSNLKQNRAQIEENARSSWHQLLLVSSNKREQFKHLLVITLLIVGLFIFITSLTCIILLPSFVSNQISKRLVLKNNSMLLERWSKPNVPMYFKVWVFDVTNAQEIVDKKDTKPKLREIGPFVFHLKRKKDIVSFAGENLYYTERKVYHFSPELSCCSINTTVTIPNIPLVAVVDRALSYNLPLVGRFIPRLINRAIQSLREQLFVRKQVREILFDGYEVELLKMVSRVGAIVGLPQTNQKFALLKGRNDTWRPEQDGVFAINTGVKDRRHFGRVASWNSYKQLPFWASPSCNQINGSDGTLFPPPISPREPLYIFNQELCRTVNLIYDRPSDVRGISSLRFVLNPLNFAHTMGPSVNTKLQSLARVTSDRTSATSVVSKPSVAIEPTPSRMLVSPSDQRPSISESGEAANFRQTNNNNNNNKWTLASVMKKDQLTPPVTGATRAEQERFVLAAQEAQLKADKGPSERNPFTCFCDRKSTNMNGINVCEFDGLIDLSKCTKQAQVIFGSMPHFHRSDSRLFNQVVGLQPNASKHTTFLDIEPNTGLVLGGKRRVQLNLLVKHNKEVDGFENINDMIVPLVWFEESAMIPEETAAKFKSLYTNRIRMINLILTSLLFASLGLILIDLKVLISSTSWHKFKLIRMSATCNTNTNSDSSKEARQTDLTEVRRKESTGSVGSTASAYSETLGKSSPSIVSGQLNLPLLANYSAAKTSDNFLEHKLRVERSPDNTTSVTINTKTPDTN